jgi:hypothetical protein
MTEPSVPPSDDWGEVAQPKRLASRGGFWTSKRLVWVILFFLGSIGLLLLLSEWNHRTFQLVCGKSAVTAEQGRYWPTGMSPLDGDAYVSIPIHLAPQCESKKFKDRAKLDEAFLSLLLQSIRKDLVPGPPANVTGTFKRLAQANLLCKEEKIPGCEERKRFQADLDFFQAVHNVKSERPVFEKALEQLRAASRVRSHHRAEAAAWAKHVEQLLFALDRPGASLIVIPIPVPARAAAPAPVKAPAPAPVTAPPPAPTPTKAPAPAADAAPDPTPAEPDIPRGGVLM